MDIERLIELHKQVHVSHTVYVRRGDTCVRLDQNKFSSLGRDEMSEQVEASGRRMVE